MRNGVEMNWLMDDTISKDAGISLAVMTVRAGVTSECHLHRNCAETIHVQSGDIKQRIGDNWVEMKAGDTCVIPIDTKHQTQNIGDCDAAMTICYSAGTRLYERKD